MLSRFTDITGFDVEDFIRESSDFLISKSQIIRLYYEGKSEFPEEIATELKSLIGDYEEFSRVTRLSGDRFKSSEYWELIDTCEDLGGKLLLVSRFDKFLRSSRSPESGGGVVLINEVLSQNESVETVAERFGTDPLEVFIENDLPEEGYSSEGGNLLKFKFESILSSKVQSIIDQPIGDRVYGVDIDMEFSMSGGDINVLPPKESVRQSLKILTGLRQGQIPENRGRGIDQNLIAGANSKSIMYPTIMRQLVDSVSTDDSFESIKIERISTEKDATFIEISARTIIGENIGDILEI